MVLAVFFSLTSTCFAGQNENSKRVHIISDESTGNVQIIEDKDYIRYETNYGDSIENVIENDIASPFVLYPTLYSYTESSHIIDKQGNYVSSISGVNNGSGTLVLRYKTETSGAFTAAATIQGTVRAEIDLIVGKVDASTTLGAVFQREWRTGQTFGSSYDVKPGKRVEMIGYIPTTTSKGTAKYKVYNSSDDKYFYDTKAVGAKVPCRNAWHIVVNEY